MKINLTTAAVLILSAFMAAVASATEVASVEELRARTGMSAPAPSGISRLTVAVLDNGFDGFENGKGLLPASAELIEGPLKDFMPTSHGLGMAQIIWTLTGKSADGPKFYLVNANGFTNMKAAIHFVIEKRVDVVLYSQVWTFGSNFDGTGFINSAVKRATRAGIIWVNAAGNFGSSVYNGPVMSNLPDTYSSGLKFVNRLDENDIEITLSWTGFAESEEVAATKDLNLFVYDEKEKLVGSSELAQRGVHPGEKEKGVSAYSREKVRLPRLDRGRYRIVVKRASSNFEARDRFRVLIDSGKPGGVEFTDRTRGGEIFPPADNPEVLTVGDLSSSSSIGPTADGRTKPDLFLPEMKVTFTNGTAASGSSVAAAVTTARIVRMKAEQPGLSRETIMDRAKGRADVQGLAPLDPRLVPPWLGQLTPPGARYLAHPNGHMVVEVTEDPFSLSWVVSSGLVRTSSNDCAIFSPMERRVFAIDCVDSWRIMPPLVEFRQR